MLNNFDFFVGTWTSRSSDGSARCWPAATTGTSSPASPECWSVFDGAGNIDEVTFPEKGFGGVTLRLYDQDTDQWSLYWASSGTGLATAAAGRAASATTAVASSSPTMSTGDAGDRCRTSGSPHSPDSCRWEQAFSTDGGDDLGDQLDRRLHPHRVSAHRRSRRVDDADGDDFGRTGLLGGDRRTTSRRREGSPCPPIDPVTTEIHPPDASSTISRSTSRWPLRSRLGRMGHQARASNRPTAPACSTARSSPATPTPNSKPR